MKKIGFTLILIVFAQITYSQVFQKSIIVSPNVTWISSASDRVKNDRVGIAYSVGGLVEYQLHFAKHLAVQSGLEYMSLRNSFQTPLNRIGIPENIRYYKNTLTQHQLTIPLIFKWNFRPEEASGSYFFSGIGFSCYFHSSAEIEEVNYDMNNPQDKHSTHVESNWGGMSEGFNSNLLVGLGKNFQLNKLNMYAQIRLRRDLKEMEYSTYDRQDSPTNNPVYEVFPVKNNTLSLMWGIVF